MSMLLNVNPILLSQTHPFHPTLPAVDTQGPHQTAKSGALLPSASVIRPSAICKGNSDGSGMVCQDPIGHVYAICIFFANLASVWSTASALTDRDKGNVRQTKNRNTSRRRLEIDAFLEGF